jgi:hypothetical protein
MHKWPFAKLRGSQEEKWNKQKIPLRGSLQEPFLAHHQGLCETQLKSQSNATADHLMDSQLAPQNEDGDATISPQLVLRPCGCTFENLSIEDGPLRATDHSSA